MVSSCHRAFQTTYSDISIKHNKCQSHTGQPAPQSTMTPKQQQPGTNGHTISAGPSIPSKHATGSKHELQVTNSDQIACISTQRTLHTPVVQSSMALKSPFWQGTATTLTALHPTASLSSSWTRKRTPSTTRTKLARRRPTHR